MSRRERWTERLLRWAVADTEAAEGLLGDLEEEWMERRGRAPGGPAYHLVLARLALGYLWARVRGGNAAGAGSAGWGRDLRFAGRALVRTPGYSAVFAATLGLGLAAALTVFAVVDSIVLRPLPYQAPTELVRLESAVPMMGPDTRWHLAKAQYLLLRDELQSVDELGLYVLNVSTVGSPDRPEDQAQRVGTVYVDPHLLPTLGIEPVRGRAFTPEETQEMPARVVMLTDGYWNRAFGRDPDVVGRTVLVDGRPLEVVGVLPADARLPEEVESSSVSTDLWMPLYVSKSERPVNSHTFRGVARLGAGADVARLNAELDRLTPTLPEVLPEAYSAQFMEEYGFHMVATPLKDDVVGTIADTLWILLGSLGLLLLVACFNAANLLLARTQRRSREMAIRAALGAGRRTLGRQLLLESVILSLVAGAAALVVAGLGVEALVRVAPDGLPRVHGVSLSPLSVGVGAALSLGLGLLFGILPAAAGADMTKVLGDTGRGMTASRRHHAARRVLVVAQLAVSVVLLAGAALLYQSYRNLSSVESGIDPENVLTFRVILPSEQYGDYLAAADYYRRALDRLEGLPGVRSAGAISALPLDGGWGCSLTFPADRPPNPNDGPPCLPVFLVTPGYFETLGIPIEGTPPSWDAPMDRRVEAFVAQATARRFWGDESALGRGVSSFGAPAAPVQAVVGDVRGAGLREPVWEATYLSIVPPTNAFWGVPRFLRIAVKTDGTEPLAIVPAVRQALTELDPRVPMSDIRPMARVVADSNARDSFVALLLGLASAFSLLLSALGVYAVISYIVQGRRGEIGVRLALGSGTGRVRSMVVGQSVRLGVLGVLLGLAAAVPVSRVLASFLYELSPTEPVILAGVAAVLLAVTGLASFAPAMRATRVDPVEALRSD